MLIDISKNEALVLYEFLVRINKEPPIEIFEDQAEQRVLWNIEAFLETQLSESFRDDYLQIIEKARQDVRDGQ